MTRRDLPEPERGVTAAFFVFVFSTMRDDVRGLIGVLLLAGAIAMAAVHLYLWGVVAGVLGIALLAVNGRHRKRR